MRIKGEFIGQAIKAGIGLIGTGIGLLLCKGFCALMNVDNFTELGDRIVGQSDEQNEIESSAEEVED